MASSSPEAILNEPSPSEDQLDLQQPILPPVANQHVGWWKLPLLALIIVALLWIGIDQQSRLRAKSHAALAGPTVSFDYSAAGAARASALLAKQGMELVETEEGISAAPVTRPAQGPAEAALPEITLPPRPARPMIAVIIDDVGLAASGSNQAVNLPPGFTLAFLPYATHLQPLVNRARANSHEIMLHLPMEGRSSANPGPNAMLTELNPEQRQQRLLANLARFSGYAGVNNHMGSAFTEDVPGMELVLAEMKRRKLFFIDSRTTSQSAARQAAVDHAVPYAERDVFLDNDQDSHHILIQLAETEARAKAHGTAIAIGHPHGATLATLAAWQKGLAKRGFDLVPASRIIAVRQTPYWRLAALKAG
jgi:polysaccharide deacetylase 2 family uncharacterized protein YibQ